MQDGLRQLASAQLAGGGRGPVAELVAFTADLRPILARLASHSPDGPCDTG